jgi:2-oxoglutarate ferredoxin oxidoreductase subunit beta
VPYGEEHGLDTNMADVDNGAPEGAMDLVREFY